MSISAELIDLCRTQVLQLTEGLGASLTAIYLAEDLLAGSETRLVPVMVYPELAENIEMRPLQLPADRVADLVQEAQFGKVRQLMPADSGSSISSAFGPEIDAEFAASGFAETGPDWSQSSTQAPMVVPLMYENTVAGLLVTDRAGSPWTEPEQQEIDRIAQTLAIARFLDQRAGWLQRSLQQQQRDRVQQRDLLDNLLHQFRNPLTALRTFGKLLLRRLLEEDPNRQVARSIIQESERLQSLLEDFDRAIDLNVSDPTPDSRPESPRQLPPGQNQAGFGSSSLLTLPPQADSSMASINREDLPQDHPLENRDQDCLGQDWETFKPQTLLTEGARQIAPAQLADVLEPLVVSMQAIAQDRDLNLQFDLPADLPDVRVSVPALREVVTNLIENALKYTPAGGDVVVYGRVISPDRDQLVWRTIVSENSTQLVPPTSEEPGYQVIAVVDTGPGIPLEDQPHLFERHFRGVQSQGQIAGTGLGLAIAEDLIHQMQGEIQVFSPAIYPDEGVNKSQQLVETYAEGTSFKTDQNPGSTFLVWLPNA